MHVPRALILSSEENRHVESAIRSALGAAGVSVIDLDNSMFGEAIRASAVSDAIYFAKVIVAEVTDQDPNIMYELGFAQALRKPTVLLVARGSSGRLPGDLVVSNDVLRLEQHTRAK